MINLQNPPRKHNLLEVYDCQSLVMCTTLCNRLSCNYFTTVNLADEILECRLYGDVETAETDHGNVTVYMKSKYKFRPRNAHNIYIISIFSDSMYFLDYLF